MLTKETLRLYKLNISTKYGPSTIWKWASKFENGRMDCLLEADAKFNDGEYEELSFEETDKTTPALIAFWCWGAKERDYPNYVVLEPDGIWEEESSNPTDEGYSDTNVLVERMEDSVVMSVDSYAKDCDGPIEHHKVLICELNKLEGGPCLRIDGIEFEEIRFPDWVKKVAYQRDVYAEMSGY